MGGATRELEVIKVTIASNRAKLADNPVDHMSYWKSFVSVRKMSIHNQKDEYRIGLDSNVHQKQVTPPKLGAAYQKV